MIRVKYLGAYLVVGSMGLLLSAAGLGAAGNELQLMEAVKKADAAAVKAVLQQRVDVNASEPDGMTALHWAVRHDDLASVDLLISAGANVNAANRFGITPLSLACTNGNAAMIERLLTAGADPNDASPEGQTPVMTAARTGKVNALKILIAHGADVNARENWKKQTALMWAAAENNAQAVKTLIEAGATVNERSHVGFTPLMFAIRAGHIEAVRALLDEGADPNDYVRPSEAWKSAIRPGSAPNAELDGSYAVGLAIINAHYDVALALIEKGADPNVPDANGSFLHALSWMRRPGVTRQPPPTPTGNIDSLLVAKALLDHGANPNVRNMWKEKKITNLRSEVQMPPNIPIGRNYISFVGATPFYLASKHTDVAYMRLLLQHGADPLISTVQGVTPLMAAAGLAFWDGESAGPESGVTLAESLEAVRLLWELGSDVNAVADFGDISILEGDPYYLIMNNPINIDSLPATSTVNGKTTPVWGDMRWAGSSVLHGAAVRGQTDIIQFLVDKGARLDAKNKLGWTPLTVAEGMFFAQTFKESIDGAILIRKLMIERGLDPSQSPICPICARDLKAAAGP